MAVIGVGVMGARHARTCKELRNIELVAVADVKAEVARAIGEELGIPSYTDYREMLDVVTLDAVTVAVTDPFHREPCEEAAARGLHIFLEKPIATTLEDARAIIDATAGADVKLMVGHTLRYDPRYKAIRRAAQDGELGDIVHVYARRNATVRSGRRLEGRTETIIFQGVHDIDALIWILGAPVTRVYAEATSKVLTDLGIADAMLATLRFANGAVALLEQSWALPADAPTLLDAQLEVVGSKGVAYIDFRAPSFALFTGGRYTQPDPILGLPEAYYLRDEHERFLDFVAGRAPPKVGGEEALAALRVAHAILQSINETRPIEIDPE
jgi:predicted dehydrogenase